MGSDADQQKKINSNEQGDCLPDNLNLLHRDDINLQDETYLITTRVDVDDLIASIRQVGLMAPPILLTDSTGYVVVSGFRRLIACRKLGWRQIPCRVMPQATPQLDCVRYAIAENAQQRPLNLVETSRALSLLTRVVLEEKRLSEIARALGLPFHRELVAKIRRICRLPQPIQTGLLTDTISMPVALELEKFTQNIGITFMGLFQELKMGLNRQREFINLVHETALREDLSIEDVLRDPGLNKILRDETLEGHQKSNRIRRWLHRRRFPNLSNAENKFASQVKELNLDQKMALTPPRQFEGTVYTFTLAFENHQELRELHDKLFEVLDNPTLKTILDR